MELWWGNSSDVTSLMCSRLATTCHATTGGGILTDVLTTAMVGFLFMLVVVIVVSSFNLQNEGDWCSWQGEYRIDLVRSLIMSTSTTSQWNGIDNNNI